MRLLLQRALFVDGTRYRVSSNGTDVPDTIEIPKGAKIWDGKEFVDVPDDKKARESLIAKSSKAVAKEEEEPDDLPPPPSYNPKYKNPETPEPIQGRSAGLDTAVKSPPDKNWQGDADKEEGADIPAPMTKPKK